MNLAICEAVVAIVAAVLSSHLGRVATSSAEVRSQPAVALDLALFVDKMFYGGLKMHKRIEVLLASDFSNMQQVSETWCHTYGSALAETGG